MADKPKKDAPAAEEPAPAPKKGPPVKLIGIVAGIMVAEAVLIYMVVGMTGPKPQPVAAEVVDDHKADEKALVEIQVVDEQYQNMQSGRVWAWRTEVVLQVKTKEEEFVTAELERRRAEVQEGIGQIIARAQPSQLKEPDRRTIIRQIAAFLDRVLGKDPDGHSRFERVLLPRFQGMEMG